MIRLHWQQIASAEITQIFCNSKFDGVVLDNEHGIFTEEQLFTLIQLINARGKRSYVRFATLDKSLVRKVMDAGVYGLIFSTIETIQQVRDIHFWCKYPPIGSRGQGLCAENEWGERPDLLQRRDPEIIAQIETKTGMEMLPILVKNMSDKIDRFLVGPYDLSASLGCCGEWDNPIFVEYMKKFDRVVPFGKKAMHIVKGVEAQFSRHSTCGMLALGMDTLALIDNVRWLDQFSKENS